MRAIKDEHIIELDDYSNVDCLNDFIEEYADFLAERSDSRGNYEYVYDFLEDKGYTIYDEDEDND